MTSESRMTHQHRQCRHRDRQGRQNTIFFSMMLLCLTVLSPIKCSYNISQFENNQDVYYDKMYDMHIIRDEWKLVIFYNMTTYWSGIEQVQDYVTNINKRLLTSPEPLPMQYKSIVFQLQQTIDDLRHYNVLLMNQNKRQKRGLINGVGYLANSLFGVLDERFCEKYESDIEKITQNENHLQNLLKNQTSIIEAQSNILHRNELTMNKQFKNLQKHLQEMILIENRSQAKLNDELYATSSFLAAEMIVSSIKSLQENLINMITEVSRGHTDIHLLPPQQLAEQINIIYSNLPTELTLPTERENLTELYRLMKMSIRIGTSYLIIETKIPLVDKQIFQLDRMISLPHSTYTVEPSVPYLAFNMANDRLLLLTENDIEECIHTSINKLLCHSNKPIYELQITKPICNLSINNKTLCRINRSACEERWIKLRNNNKWLYTCCEQCDVRIFCPAETVQLKTLYRNGLLHIGQGCSIKGNAYSIIGHNNFLSNTEAQSNIPTVPEISILNEIQRGQSYDTNNFMTSTIETDEKEWSNLKKQINSLKEQTEAPLNIHDVHHYVAQYTTLFLLIIGIIVYIIIRRYKARKQQLLAMTKRTRPHIELVSVPKEAEPRVMVDRPLKPSTQSLQRPSNKTSPKNATRAVRLDIPTDNF